MVFVDLIVNLPCAFTLGFLIVHVMRGHKTIAQRYFAIILSFLVVLFFTNSIYYFRQEDNDLLLACITIKHFVSPSLPILALVYLMSLMGEKMSKRRLITLAMIPLISVATISAFNFYIGIDKVENFLADQHNRELVYGKYLQGDFAPYIIVNIYLYYLLIWIECAYLAFKAQAMMRMNDFSVAALKNFMFCNGRISPINLMCLFAVLMALGNVLRTLFPRWVLIEYQSISILQCLIVAIIMMPFCYVALYTNIKEVTLRILCAPIEEGMKSNGPVEGKGVETLTSMEDELLIRFNEIMERERPYLNESLRLDDMARIIGTNRLYMSRLVNTRFGMSFPDYVNGLRIEYAKKYMLQHPSSPQEEIALKSGFASAQSFNRRFRQDVGLTPAKWLHSMK